MKEGNTIPSWVAFSLAQADVVSIDPFNYPTDPVPFRLELMKDTGTGQNQIVWGFTQVNPGQRYTTPLLEPGFYIAVASSLGPRDFFGLSLWSPSLFGGLSGGWLDSQTGVGFGAFDVPSPQKITLKLLFGEGYGDLGVGQPFLQVYYQKPDGSRELYWASANVAEQELNDEPAIATPIATYPWTVSGTLQSDNDEDYFKFPGTKGDIISVVITKTDPNFKPMLSIEKETGQPLRDINFSSDEDNLDSEKFSAQLPTTGDFYLLVADQNGRGADSFTYTVSIFIDEDVDGLADSVETTLGLVNGLPDTDGDGILDGAEAKGNQDIDGDGSPNWLDLDSDNDGIPDQQEGSADADGDGLGNFVDADADGNGIADKDEIGPDPKQSLDFDNDDVPDYLDTDDDNDGLMDSKDDNRIAPIASSDILDLTNRVYLESTTVVFGDKVLEDTARAGDTLILKGAGVVLKSG